ncbi:PP2C family protein-serine/threonine phosphatase [Spirosoma soli]|uniref:PP2C family protein-serine/threonine phosphatase n=1 Tax=Spirosoma soli TaxID=1770529 RepID=UPI0036D3410B
MIQIAGQTDVGQRRQDNQDTFVCTPIWSDTSALLAAIDGVGGYAGGDRAAAIAKESIERYMTTPNGDPLSMLREAVVFANNQINEQRQQDRRLGQMCCVLSAAVADVDTSKLYFVHVGDTRLYRYRQGVLEKLTHDHSLVGVREDANELTELEAMHHPRRNEILREVGSTAHRVDDPDFLEWGETDFLPGDQLLLCSDGLTDMITRAQIVQILNEPLTLDEQAARLIKAANAAGGNDNITVVLAKNSKPLTGHMAPVIDVEVKKVEGQKVPATSAFNEPVATVKSAKRSTAGVWIAMGLVLVLVIAGVVWYQIGPSDTVIAQADSLTKSVTQSDSASALVPTLSRFDSLVQIAQRSQDHRLVLTNDTFRLDKPLVLSDSLQTIMGGDRLTVFVPRDTSQTVAVRVTRRGLVNLENIVISGFKTGIETTGDGKLRLSKVYFRGVDQPILATVRQDTFQNTVIGVSAQNQPVSTQTPRR